MPTPPGPMWMSWALAAPAVAIKAATADNAKRVCFMVLFLSPVLGARLDKNFRRLSFQTRSPRQQFQQQFRTEQTFREIFLVVMLSWCRPANRAERDSLPPLPAVQ